MKSATFKLGLVLAVMEAMMLSGCSKDHKKPTFDYMPHMNDSFAVKAQHLGPFGEGMRTPPKGTLAVDKPAPYRYVNDAEGAAQMKNPVPRTRPMLVRGQHLYNTYCIVCHGVKGEGNGTIVPKFPQPPTLHSEKIRGWSDGQLFHVMTVGQNLMPSYATQLNEEERWAVANYVRVLQRALNPTDADVRDIQSGAFKKKAGK